VEVLSYDWLFIPIWNLADRGSTLSAFAPVEKVDFLQKIQSGNNFGV
jgi:hypothetical protein